MADQASDDDLDSLVSSLTTESPDAPPEDQPDAEAAEPLPVEPPPYDWAIVLDLDFAAVDGAEAFYRAAERVLAGQDVEFDAGRFVRHLLGNSPTAGLNSLMQHQKKPNDTVATLAKELLAGFQAEIVGLTPRPAVQELIRQAATANGHVVALSSLPGAAAEQLRSIVGLPDDATIVLEPAEWLGYHPTETWARVQQGTALPERHCMAVVGTADNARSALMANLNIAAFIGERTEAQDFGGVDWLGAGAEPADAEAVLDLLRSRL